ncbi:Polyketide synthase-nonribosomal peptide synthetase hybrid himA [Labeo rohita]|uniref:Polyketide synthase-nonribosomal peptide synthetase hybrid himA n=1 Tax=Labeo rohita TaxID=84645 RepID=A0ABQ8L060_LABRO|nr:Polyketide synthase-nonribosomal peptide synthetase hybrid himA [Labeo rohita]
MSAVFLTINLPFLPDLHPEIEKDLVKGQGFPPDEVAELHRTTDLALRAAKQATTHMGRVTGTLVVTERHLWETLADISKKERGFLLNAPVSPSVLFGTSVETVVERFMTHSAAFKSFIPRRSRSEAEQHRTSAVTHAPPPPVGGYRIWHRSRGGRQGPREVIQTRQLSHLDQKAAFTDGPELRLLQAYFLLWSHVQKELDRSSSKYLKKLAGSTFRQSIDPDGTQTWPGPPLQLGNLGLLVLPQNPALRVSLPAKPALSKCTIITPLWSVFHGRGFCEIL